MKIFQLIGTLGDGGAETLVKDYSLLLKEDGHDVIIITIFPNLTNTANFNILKENSITIFSLFKHNNLLTRLIFKIFKRSLLPILFAKIYKRHLPEVIHIHLANLYLLKPISKIIANTKLFYTCHSLPEVFIGDNAPHENIAAKHLLLNNNLQMIALHDDMRIEINKILGINNTIVVNNGIDFNKYIPLTECEKRQLQNEIGLSSEDYVIGHIGRFAEVKNHKLLVSILADILKIIPNAKLLMIGTGPLEQNIRNNLSSLGISDRAIILHNRTDVHKLLRLMDVFVFPSLYEGLGIALIEAQVAELRCVISDKVNPAAIVSPKTIQVRLDANIEAWVEAILNTNIENQSYGEITNFNLRKEIKLIENLYEN